MAKPIITIDQRVDRLAPADGRRSLAAVEDALLTLLAKHLAAALIRDSEAVATSQDTSLPVESESTAQHAGALSQREAPVP